MLGDQLHHKLDNLLIFGNLDENFLELVAINQQKVKNIANSSHELKTVIQRLKRASNNLYGPLSICLVLDSASSLN